MIILLLLIILANCLLYAFFPKPKQAESNATYDFLLVLGCPANQDGTLSSFQKKRIHAAITYYTQGFANVIVISGGSVHNEYSEAEVIANAIRIQLPDADIRLETSARNTYQNMKHVKAMMQGDMPLVISGSSHLRRAYFMVRKFYPDASMGFANEHDPWYAYVWEYTRMWVALFWEARLSLRKKN